ncbi:MAG: DUF4293 family protein [Bacteroidetes bacterium]|nr:DUF4293 family protein [Bacteroidota bacterium]
MIQRLQTVYLLLAVVFLAIMFLAQGAWTGVAASTYSWYVPVTMGIFGLSAAGGVTAIFLYKDRQRQRGFVVLLQYLIVVGMLTKMVATWLTGGFASVMTDASFDFWLGFGSPVMTYLMFLMARRGIDRDIALLKSMDRLR